MRREPNAGLIAYDPAATEEKLPMKRQLSKALGQSQAISPLLVVVVMIGMVGALGIVALVTRDRYDLKVRSGQHEFQLRPAGELPQLKVEGR